MKQASREATILLYGPVLDRHLEARPELAVPWSSSSTICMELGYGKGRSISEEMASQTYLGGLLMRWPCGADRGAGHRGLP
jgi:hypothetical protein